MNDKYKPIIPYLLASIGFLVTVIIVILIVDLVLFPLLIHDKDSVKMPDVTGKTITDAENIIIQNGLTIGKINEVYNETFKEGTVINQIPKVGGEVKSGRNIILTISKGKEMVAMPFLVGQHIRTARITLKNKGLEIGNISYEHNDNYGNDTVMVQMISSGRMVPYGSSVDIIVSKGSQNQIKVPYLVGKPYDEVNSILIESGLEIGNISWQTHDTYLPNTIVSQKPESGSLLRAGEKVDLIISK
jgi:serine/threonine-protein kinase